jgi:hypothetical protein
MSTREEILAEIEQFLKETGMSATKFGDRAISDRALMFRLRGGRDLKLATVDKIRAFMAKERKKRVKPTPPKKAREQRAEAA